MIGNKRNWQILDDKNDKCSQQTSKFILQVCQFSVKYLLCTHKILTVYPTTMNSHQPHTQHPPNTKQRKRLENMKLSL